MYQVQKVGTEGTNLVTLPGGDFQTIFAKGSAAD
jgi:hypothetical protein